MSGTLLGIWAHPDDEAYLSAGLMAAARRAGRRVVVVSATSGERGTADPDRWPPARLGALRRDELRASLAELDVHEHHVLGLPDGGCALSDGAPLIGEIVADVKPATIVTFGPDGMTGHPDHRAVSRWTTEAWEAEGCRGELWYATVTPAFHRRWAAVNAAIGLWSGTDDAPCTETPGLAIELSGEHLRQKLAALRAHRSQTAPLIELLGDDVFSAWWAIETFVAATVVREERRTIAATGLRSG